MKRITIIFLIALVLILVVVFSFPKKTALNAPRFVPVTSQPVGPFGSENYGWHDPVPFRDGKTWIWTVLSRTNHHSYLYDLDKRITLGELLNAGYVLANQDQTKLLCESAPSPLTRFKTAIIDFINSHSLGKINLPANCIEAFWMLDLRNNSAVRIGELAQSPGSGSGWYPAPGFRYAFNRPSTSYQNQEIFLCDLEKGVLEKIKFPNKIEKGWWDDHNILAQDSSNNFVLFDVVTRKTKMLFTAEAIVEFLKVNGIPNEPSRIATTFNWNGHNYDIYFSANRDHGLNTNTTFLIKAERLGPTLKLLYRDFKFEWGAHLDATATHYLYDGQNGAPGNGGNGGIFLRDLRDGSERVIVPPDNGGQYSLARFYGDSVIYSRNRVLWRVDLNTTNAVRIFTDSGNGK
ncbi:MAG: hypothetical protein M3Y82_00280 [Verrucomicrobiota bacterium]|nr:hypothetical protein [Verrucomicrobiota bacterium]